MLEEHGITEWASNIGCYVRVCDVVMIIHSCKLSCLCWSCFVVACSTQFQHFGIHRESLPFGPKYTTNKKQKAWFSIGSISKLASLVRISLVTVSSVIHQLGWPTNLRNGCLADAAACCGRVLLRSQVLQLAGNLKPLAPWIYSAGKIPQVQWSLTILVSTYSHAYIYIYVTYIYITYIYICVTYIYIYTYICIYIYTYICIYIYIYIQIYIFVYIHIDI